MDAAKVSDDTVRGLGGDLEKKMLLNKKDEEEEEDEGIMKIIKKYQAAGYTLLEAETPWRPEDELEWRNCYLTLLKSKQEEKQQPEVASFPTYLPITRKIRRSKVTPGVYIAGLDIID